MNYVAPLVEFCRLWCNSPATCGFRACVSALATTVLFLIGTTAGVLAAPRKAHVIQYAELQGKPVRSIKVTVKDVFEGEDLPLLYRTANSLKINTKEVVVRREMLFKEGDPFDEFAMRESERFIRLLPFIRSVESYATGTDDGQVDVEMVIQDSWTFLPTFNYSSGAGNNALEAGIIEGNLAGYGKRLELLYGEQDNRTTFQGVWEDIRLMGTFKRALLGYFDRSDGERVVVEYERPFRTLLDKYAWSVNADYGTGVGRLWRNGNERYIFHSKRTDLRVRYSQAAGDPEQSSLFRYSFGWDLIEDDFSDATDEDFRNIDLDPTTVSRDPRLLAEDRRFSGPNFSITKLDPRFIEMAYIDRFDRVQDYNLGSEYALGFTLAPESFGSREDNLLFSSNTSRGVQFSPSSFLRGEVGLSGRAGMERFENMQGRMEVKYYNVLGESFFRDVFLGKHTLAANFVVDYGHNLDRDREFLLGADNALRGYESRTFAGTKRLVLNLEDRVHLAEDLYRLISVGFAAFVDVGGATRKHFGDILENELYSNVGMGLRFAFPRSSGGRVLRIDVAFPLRPGPDGSDRYEPRVLFSGGQLFGSRLRGESFGPERANVEVGPAR